MVSTRCCSCWSGRLAGVDEDGSVEIDAQDNDTPGDPAFLSILTQPSHGTATVDDGGTPDDPGDDKLVFEFDIKWRKGAGPKAVVEGKQENKATVRVAAALRGERLVGKFGVYLADGTEAYRGEWKAVRAKEAKGE